MGVADLVKTPAGGLEVRIGVVPVDSARSGGDARFRAALETYAAATTRCVARPLAELKRPLVRERRPVSARRPDRGSAAQRAHGPTWASFAASRSARICRPGR